MSWGIGLGSMRGGDDEDLVHVGGHRPGAAALGDASLEQCRPGLDADDGVQLCLGIGLQSHSVADDHPRGVALGLAGEHGADLSALRRDAIDRPVTLEYGTEQCGHHSAGARAIDSSSAALTSYRDRAFRRSSASAAVRPQARVSVSTWPTGRSPPADQRTNSSAAP